MIQDGKYAGGFAARAWPTVQHPPKKNFERNSHAVICRRLLDGTVDINHESCAALFLLETATSALLAWNCDGGCTRYLCFCYTTFETPSSCKQLQEVALSAHLPTHILAYHNSIHLQVARSALRSARQVYMQCWHRRPTSR